MDDEKKKITKPPDAKRAPVFSLERLRRDCMKLFGISTSTFDGATFGLTGEYSVEGLREHIKKWQKTQVYPVKEVR